MTPPLGSRPDSIPVSSSDPRASSSAITEGTGSAPRGDGPRVAVLRNLCGRTFLASETRGRAGVSLLWQAMPGTASGRPRGFRAALFQDASEACLSVVTERQAYSSDAISDLERRARLRPGERGHIARWLAEASLTPHLPHAAQILSALQGLLPRAARADQASVLESFVAGLGSPDRVLRLRSFQMLRWMLATSEGHLEERSRGALSALVENQPEPVAEALRRLLSGRGDSGL